MKMITIFITLLMLGISAKARIGETPAQCVARYGEPLSVDKETMTLGFQKQDIFIMCVFHEGKCVEVAFKKTEADFSKAEVETLLNANGSEWTSIPAGVGETHWNNVTSVATHKELESMVIIMTHAAKKHRDEAKIAAEKKKLEGF